VSGAQRSLWLAVIGVCAIALPVLVYLGNAMDAQRRVQVMYHNALVAQQQGLEDFARRSREFEGFREQAEEFVAYAGEQGVEAERWLRHEVNVQRLAVGFDDLRTLLAKMHSSERAWFVPASLQVTIPERGRDAVAINRDGLAVPPEDVDPDFRERATVSLTGEFLVYQQ